MAESENVSGMDLLANENNSQLWGGAGGSQAQEWGAAPHPGIFEKRRCRSVRVMRLARAAPGMGGAGGSASVAAFKPAFTQTGKTGVV